MQEYILLAKELQNKTNLDLTSDYVLDQLDRYCDSLIYWNGLTNLPRIIQPDDIFIKHFYDSLTCLYLWKREWEVVYDVGTGGGFPGVPLAIVLPNVNFILVESNEKKCQFLTDLVSILNLDNVQILNKRSESIKSENGDAVLSRALSRADIILETTCRLLKVGGYNLQMRGERFKDDAELTNQHATKLGYTLQKDLKIVDVKNRTTGLLLYKYIQRADNKYPRNYASILRK